MCVPVRFNSSRRKSTSNVRGSTPASHGFPFTFTRTGTFSAADIFVTRLHLLSASAAGGNANGALYEHRDQPSLVLRRAAHIALRLGGCASRLCSGFDGLRGELRAAQRRLGKLRPNGRQAHAAQHDARVRAGVLIAQNQLNGSTRAGIHGSAALECPIGAAAFLWRDLNDDLAQKLGRAERGSVSIFEKVAEREAALALGPMATNRGVQREQNRRPIAARIRFGERAANGALISHLHVGDARGAVMDNRNAPGDFGGFDIRMASQRAEMQLAAALLNPGKAWKEIDIYEIARARQPHLHQRNEALPPGEQPGLPTELRQ